MSEVATTKISTSDGLYGGQQTQQQPRTDRHSSASTVEPDKNASECDVTACIYATVMQWAAHIDGEFNQQPVRRVWWCLIDYKL